jgi:TorA maturation chaperone TorD
MGAIDFAPLSVMFGLLGKVFYEYPNRSFYEGLHSEAVFAEMPVELDNDDFRAAQALLASWDAAPLDFAAIEADYMRLFILGDKFTAPPYQSIYLSIDKLMFQPSTLKVREWYKKYDLMAERQYSEPDDHVGLMLRFAGYLADKAENGDDAAKADLDSFCTEQMLNWVPKWCDLVTEHAKTDFFKGIAQLTKGLLQVL